MTQKGYRFRALMSEGLVFLSHVHLIHSNKRHTAFDSQIGKERLQLKMNLLKAPKQHDGSQSHQGAWLALPYGCYSIPDQRCMRNFVMGVTGREWKLLSEKQLHCYLT